MEIIRKKDFANGIVYCLEFSDGRLIETTDTFLPYYTKNAINEQSNKLKNSELGSRKERWMIGVSVMSGCPVRCGFCATGTMQGFRNLTAEEIVEQVDFIVQNNKKYSQSESKEFKINYTRMGEPFLNIDNVKEAIMRISAKYDDVHHYISTIGIKNADYSWIDHHNPLVDADITLQLSIHSFDNEARNKLIPFVNKATIEELGKIRTNSRQKTTINLTLVNNSDFNIEKLKMYFPKEHFFIKLSPINKNTISEKNNIGEGVIHSNNII